MENGQLCALTPLYVDENLLTYIEDPGEFLGLRQGWKACKVRKRKETKIVLDQRTRLEEGMAHPCYVRSCVSLPLCLILWCWT
jgi:hypothetical protein